MFGDRFIQYTHSLIINLDLILMDMNINIAPVFYIFMAKQNLKSASFIFFEETSKLDLDSKEIQTYCTTLWVINNLVKSLLVSNTESLINLTIDFNDFPNFEYDLSFLKLLNRCCHLKKLKVLFPTRNISTDTIFFLKQNNIEFSLTLSSFKLFNSQKISHCLNTFTNLKRLILFDCQIFRIDNFSSLINLEYLSLAHNYIYEIDPNIFFPKLKVLDLKYNNLCSIPKILFLSNLKYLDVSYNYISDIQDLSNLRKLQEFKAHNNLISDVQSLNNLTNLKTLFLANNEIVDISPLSRLVNLVSLELSFNSITKALIFNNFKSLQFLLLCDNEINKFHISDDSQLLSLTQLNLANNKLSTLKNIDKLINLKGLVVSSNKLTELSDGILNLKELTSLYLTDNEIKGCFTIKNGYFNKLKFFEINNNLISNIKIENNSLQNVISLSLTHNQLQKIEFINNEESIFNSFLPRIENLKLNNNQIESMEWLKDIAFNSRLKFVNLSGNKIKTIEKLNNLQYLHIFNLAQNKINNYTNLSFYSQVQDLILKAKY
ncbi:leucine-rich repeat domain-containing protein [Ascoidea rubescens DSM 1968]|uniref:L domain-like protein n=1 Tax=Ascoidea rubescens DSM 1968 TaxID=1344418 RepID=A0A1D2V9I3_9ASCO|nr:L domain-like protein [Ascoidea rubescens DSM 1968]ODV58175.1 L domain-like protein [Ascoidea rubescens DSM 1968]